MSKQSDSKSPKSQAPQGGGLEGEGKAPRPVAAEALISPAADIDPDTRKKLAAAAECEPDQVLSYREYSDRTIVVVQTATTVEKRTIQAWA